MGGAVGMKDAHGCRYPNRTNRGRGLSRSPIKYPSQYQLSRLPSSLRPLPTPGTKLLLSPMGLLSFWSFGPLSVPGNELSNTHPPSEDCQQHPVTTALSAFLQWLLWQPSASLFIAPVCPNSICSLKFFLTLQVTWG